VSETSELVSPFVDWVNAYPCAWAMRVNSGLIRLGKRWLKLAPKGTPDVLWCVDGRMYATEFKVGRRNATVAQEREHARMGQAGIVVYVRSDLELAREDVRAAIADRGER
jgi:hypothetical protein